MKRPSLVSYADKPVTGGIPTPLSYGVVPPVAPVFGPITASKDGSAGQTYTINGVWADVQWYRMALAFPYDMTEIPGAMALSYVARSSDEGFRIAARGKVAGVEVAAKALQPVAPPALDAPPAGFAYVIDNAGRYLLWRKTTSSEPAYLLTRIN